MKNRMKIVLLFYALMFFTACKPSQQLQVLQPAMMKIPDHINVIAVVDRSKPSKGWLNVLEGTFTGEGINQDRGGRQRTIQGLTEALSKTPRFTVKATSIELTGSETGSSMLPPLDWYDIEGICRKYNADAVVVIEMFDSDVDTRTDRRDIKEKTKAGKDTSRVEFTLQRRLAVNVGWRLYDPTNKVIIDEVTTTRGADSEGRGDTESKARNNLPSPYNIINDISYGAGLDYGARIAPTWITVNRTYYGSVKGNYKADMERAARYAEAKEWIKAAEIWKRMAEQRQDLSTAGKAAYNMAIANEFLGKLDLAVDWATKAYTELGNKNAKSYIDILKRRISDDDRVKYQMAKPKKGV